MNFKCSPECRFGTGFAQDDVLLHLLQVSRVSGGSDDPAGPQPTDDVEALLFAAEADDAELAAPPGTALTIAASEGAEAQSGHFRPCQHGYGSCISKYGDLGQHEQVTIPDWNVHLLVLCQIPIFVCRCLSLSLSISSNICMPVLWAIPIFVCRCQTGMSIC